MRVKSGRNAAVPRKYSRSGICPHRLTAVFGRIHPQDSRTTRGHLDFDASSGDGQFKKPGIRAAGPSINSAVVVSKVALFYEKALDWPAAVATLDMYRSPGVTLPRLKMQTVEGTIVNAKW